jgi:tetratricopeptide (TPR) repeat protein
MAAFSSFSSRRRRWLAIACAVVALLALWGSWGWFPHRAEPASPELSTPKLALVDLQAQSLYFNGSAHPWLVALRPDLLAPERTERAAERLRAFAQAVQDPALFRKLDRQHHFDVLLLLGEPRQYQPLLDHLLESKDWALSYVDHTSVIFRRGRLSDWRPAALSAIEQAFIRPGERADFLGLAASKMLSLRMTDAARDLLKRADRLGGESVEVLCTWADYHMNRAEWARSLALTDRILSRNPGHLGALATRSWVLFVTKRYEESLMASRKLIEAYPQHSHLLFSHAKIAHQRGAFDEEIEVLIRLIRVAQEAGSPTAEYRMYLAQAYAEKSEAKDAIDQLVMALSEGGLPEKQLKYTQELLARIRSRSGH